MNPLWPCGTLLCTNTRTSPQNAPTRDRSRTTFRVIVHQSTSLAGVWTIILNYTSSSLTGPYEIRLISDALFFRANAAASNGHWDFPFFHLAVCALHDVTECSFQPFQPSVRCLLDFAQYAHHRHDGISVNPNHLHCLLVSHSRLSQQNNLLLPRA